MVLLRHLLGDVLRRLRLRQGRTLREVSASARVSLGYLSEVERGQKEASSELLSAICTALDTPLSHVLREVSDNFALAELQSNPVLEGPREPAPALRSGGASRPAQPALNRAREGVLSTVRLRPARAEMPAGKAGMVQNARLVQGDGDFDRLTDGGDFTTGDLTGDLTGDFTDMVPV
jgi:transcriptional regulator with XRE-family HTH domain